MWVILQEIPAATDAEVMWVILQEIPAATDVM